MADEQLIYCSRIVRLPLSDNEGTTIGRVEDIVLVPSHKRAPRVLGFVASVQRRKIFVNAARVAELDSSGIRLRGGAIDLRHFHLRAGEVLAADQILDRRHGTNVINDIALRHVEGKVPWWEVAAVALGSPGPLRRRRSSRVVDWKEIDDFFDSGPVAQEVASIREMHPSEVAKMLISLPLERRQQLAAAMDDERLADLLEELPEDEQLKIVENINLDRLAHIVEEMDPDDAVDFLGQMPGEQRIRLLATMDPEEARPLRRLLLYDTKTAGGLMTSEPIILGPETTVAEALARVRRFELPPALAAQVFVVRPPTETPTGAYLGVVGIQRLLREAPSAQLESVLESDSDAVEPNMPELDVASRLAQYDLLAIAVVDGAGRLLGAVTVDDIIDHLLPPDWRRTRGTREATR